MNKCPLNHPNALCIVLAGSPIASVILKAALPESATAIIEWVLKILQIPLAVLVLPQFPVINILLFLRKTNICEGTVKQYSNPSNVLYFVIGVFV